MNLYRLDLVHILRKMKINLDIYFLTSLWFLSMFYEGRSYKTFLGNKEMRKQKPKLIFISIQLSEMQGARNGLEGLITVFCNHFDCFLFFLFFLCRCFEILRRDD